MPSSIDAPYVIFSYKSYTLIYNEIPHFNNTYQTFQLSDLLQHILLRLQILAALMLFPITYFILWPTVYFIWLTIMFHQILY